MPSDNFKIFQDLYQTILLYLERSVVQTQMLIIAAVLVVAALIFLLVRIAINHWLLPKLESQHQGRGGQFLKHSLFILQDITFPTLALLTLEVVRYQFSNMGAVYGLFKDADFVLGILLLYRLSIAIAYQCFDQTRIRGYDRWFLAPLYLIFVLSFILFRLIDFNQLHQLVLFESDEAPLTLGVLFLSTIGLYFWIQLVLVVEDILKGLGERYTTMNIGTIEGMSALPKYGLIIMGIVTSLTTLGMSEATIATITGGLSVGIGFGMRDVITNFISGILLLFEQSLRPGDVIHIDGELGEVKKMSIRSTIIKTMDNVEKVLPNMMLFTSAVTNYTHSDPLVRVKLPLEVSEATASPDYMNYILDVANRHDLVEADPAPEVAATGFGDSSVTYNLMVWITNPRHIAPVTSDLYKAIWAGYEAHGFGNSTPKRELELLTAPKFQLATT